MMPGSANIHQHASQLQQDANQKNPLFLAAMLAQNQFQLLSNKKNVEEESSTNQFSNKENFIKKEAQSTTYHPSKNLEKTSIISANGKSLNIPQMKFYRFKINIFLIKRT